MWRHQTFLQLHQQGIADTEAIPPITFVDVSAFNEPPEAAA